MFVNQFQKLFSYVGGHVHTEGWIEPDYIPGSVSYSFRRGGWGRKGKRFTKATFLQGILVRVRSICEFGIIAR